MKHRDNSQWVIAEGERRTPHQQLGGAIYDFISSHAGVLYAGRSKSLLSCVRESTGMSDPTLKKVFRGETDSLTHFFRVISGVQCWLSSTEWVVFERTLSVTINVYIMNHGDEFLDEQRQNYRPKRRPPPTALHFFVNSGGYAGVRFTGNPPCC